MRLEARRISGAAAASLAVALAFTVGLRAVHAQAEHVRWDIISVDIPITTLSPGGVAYAFARNPSTLKIKLTGAGRFVAPASGGTTATITAKASTIGV